MKKMKKITMMISMNQTTIPWKKKKMVKQERDKAKKVTKMKKEKRQKKIKMVMKAC